jgi:hypothetical protein
MHLRSTIFQGLPDELFGFLLREGADLFRPMTLGEKILVVIKREGESHPCVMTFVKGQLVDFGTWADAYYSASASDRTPSLCALIKLPEGFNSDRMEIPEQIRFALTAYTATLPESVDCC